MGIFDRHYLEEHALELNRDGDFREAGRWFSGRVAYVCDEDALWLDIGIGRVNGWGTGAVRDATFTLGGTEAAWRELLSPETVNGTITRLFRQGKIQIDGDMVQVMFFWKMVFAMTQAAGRVRLPAGDSRPGKG